MLHASHGSTFPSGQMQTGPGDSHGMNYDEQDVGGQDTVLGRMLEGSDWAGALSRIASHPHEACAVHEDGRRPGRLQGTQVFVARYSLHRERRRKQNSFWMVNQEGGRC